MTRSLRLPGRSAWIGALIVLLVSTTRAAGPDQGILWEVHRDGERLAYLFGTVHSDREEVLDLPPPVRRAFDRSRRYAFELDMQAIDPAAIGRVTRLSGDQTLKTILPDPLWQRARAAARERGLAPTTAALLEPWALAITLALPPTDPRAVLDHELQRAARADGHPVTGLETATEQLAIFDELPRGQQIEMLRSTVEQIESGQADRLYADLVDAWLARDLGRLARIAERHPTLPDAGDNEALMNRLLRERNRRMVERMEPLLARGDAFIAVGAMHLVDDDGLIRLLERRGYELRPVY
ncbi:MAG: TraB/GumN family protein [Halofilum sp. (in: g-proteobacteria)]|nr:TraB/GumN family protein [Halofilum sp. (in: g-proteobacteria)]